MEQAEQLCGDANEELRAYCLGKVIHGRIVGQAILRIPDQERTWTAVIETLMQKFKPKTKFHHLLFQARIIKIHNSKYMFNKLENIESQANEIYDFNDGGEISYKKLIENWCKSQLIMYHHANPS